MLTKIIALGIVVSGPGLTATACAPVESLSDEDVEDAAAELSTEPEEESSGSVAGSKPGRTRTSRPLGSAISIGVAAGCGAEVTTRTGRNSGFAGADGSTELRSLHHHQ